MESSYELPEIFFQHCQLEYIPTHIHLGLHLASDLKVGNHITFIVNKAYKKLGLLKKTSNLVWQNYSFKMYTVLLGLFLYMLLLFGMAAVKAKWKN